MDKLVWLTAKDRWVLFIKPRKQNRLVYYEPEKIQEMVDIFGTTDLMRQLDSANDLSKLKDITGIDDDFTLDLLVLKAEGHTYKSLSEILKIPKSTLRDKIIKAQIELFKHRRPSKPSDPNKKDL